MVGIEVAIYVEIEVERKKMDEETVGFGIVNCACLFGAEVELSGMSFELDLKIVGDLEFNYSLLLIFYIYRSNL